MTESKKHEVENGGEPYGGLPTLPPIQPLPGTKEKPAAKEDVAEGLPAGFVASVDRLYQGGKRTMQDILDEDRKRQKAVDKKSN